MAGINSLNSIYHKRGIDFINRLLNSDVIINTPTQGVFFGFTYLDGEFTFYKKAGNITKIDRIISKYYEPAIKMIKSTPRGILNTLPKTYMYGFEYLNVDKPSLTISYIYDGVNKIYIHDKQTLTQYANRFEVDGPPILFEGKLNREQRVQLLDYVYTNTAELKEKFNTESFSEYILKVLGVNYDEFDINSIVFRFYPNGKTREAYVAKLVDPGMEDMKRISKMEKVTANDYVYFLLNELINYIEQYTIAELDKFVYSVNTYEDNYILLMNRVFKEFIEDYGTKYIDITFNKPEYLKNAAFDVNIERISDEKVLGLINLNENYKEIYKILLNFFRKKKNKTQGMFDKNMLTRFNGLVEKLNKILLRQDIFESYFPNIEEFINPIRDISESAFDDIDNDIEPQKVNLMIDNFDIINNAHIKLAQTLNNRNKLPVVMIMVNFGTEVIPEQMRMELVNNCIAEYPFITTLFVNDLNSLEDIVRNLHPNIAPMLCATNISQIGKYVEEKVAMRKDKDFNIKMEDGFKIIDVTLTADTPLFDIIKKRDFSTFKKQTPECNHSYFFELDSLLNNNQ